MRRGRTKIFLGKPKTETRADRSSLLFSRLLLLLLLFPLLLVLQDAGTVLCVTSEIADVSR